MFAQLVRRGCGSLARASTTILSRDQACLTPLLTRTLCMQQQGAVGIVGPCGVLGRSVHSASAAVTVRGLAATQISVPTRGYAKKAKGKGKGKAKPLIKDGKFVDGIPAGRSKRKQRILEAREARNEELKHAKATAEGYKEEVIDFSPKAQKCDVLTAIVREEIHTRTQERPVPKFYPGSIMRVTYHDSLSRNPKRVVGLCIARRNRGLGSTFTLRNVDDGVSYEMIFDLYSPLVTSIEVLELARRRRAKLYYLRDRPAKESLVRPNFEPVKPDPSGRVPVKRASNKPYQDNIKSGYATATTSSQQSN
eukprot:m.36867 g.36867  ORF g.36867 m.36867 type:complete len:308 (+) comp10045_c0_seq2:185-1108(+)